jgi:prevent-host-death family protein
MTACHAMIRLAEALYGAAQPGPRYAMSAIRRKGAEEARNQLPDVLEAAEKGEATIITKHGRPVAALIPISAFSTAFASNR